VNVNRIVFLLSLGKWLRRGENIGQNKDFMPYKGDWQTYCSDLDGNPL
jgi:hypothetical protein